MPIAPKKADYFGNFFVATINHARDATNQIANTPFSEFFATG